MKVYLFETLLFGVANLQQLQVQPAATSEGIARQSGLAARLWIAASLRSLQ
jgi:hypothetical protein